MGFNPNDPKYIPLDQCKHGHLYRIGSRNLAFGVYNEPAKGFVGIRCKFDREYLFTEYHYDTGPPFGTAFPYEELEKCPLEDLAESHLVTDDENTAWRTNRPLFNWIDAKRKEYTPPPAK